MVALVAVEEVYWVAALGVEMAAKATKAVVVMVEQADAVALRGPEAGRVALAAGHGSSAALLVDASTASKSCPRHAVRICSTPGSRDPARDSSLRA